MKLRIDIECTPEEARSFFGLPELSPLHAELTQALAERMREALANSDPETLMKTWMPAGLEGFERLQKMFWGAATTAAGGAQKKQE